MGCTSCGGKINGVCKVCELLDGDKKVKKVTYCNMCGVHICNDCDSDIERRWNAFLKLRLGITA